jgi:hypothetical protein
MRQLMACAADLVERSAFDRIIARNRPVIAMLYPEQPIALTADERASSMAVRADLQSHYTHSTASWRPLIEIAAVLIADVVEMTGAVISVPELANLDPQTAYALIEAARTHRQRLSSLYVGHDPAFARSPTWVWGVPVSWRLEQIRAQLCDYQLCPRSREVWLHDPGEATSVPPVPENAWNTRSPDAIALATLAALSETQPVAPAVLDDCVSALRWATEVYAFAQAFQIGALLEPYRERLDRAAQANHAWLTAVAATNAHFVDTATPGFDEPLYAMYERALALCSDPVMHASLSTRLAFAAVERGGGKVGAYLERATALVHGLEAPLAASYYRAWLAIAHALDRIHDADLLAADHHAQIACTMFTQAAVLAGTTLPRPQAERLQREASCARFMVMAHCATHAAGIDDTLAARWLAQAEAEQTTPVGHVDVEHAEHTRVSALAVLRFEVFHWVLLRQSDDDWRLVYERCRVGIHDAEHYWDARSWYLYHAVAAECAYRMGLSADAAVHCRRLLAAGAFGSPGIALVGDIRPLALRVLLRVGDHAAVLALVERWQADPTSPPSAESRALTAGAYAVLGERSSAMAALGVAIEDAVELGEHVAMLRVATMVVQVLIQLNDRDEAIRALDNVWELAEDEPGQFSGAISPSDCLRLCTLHVQLIGMTGVLLVRALALLPQCLSDAESWWDITTLLDQLVCWYRRGGQLPPEAIAALTIVRRFARDRTEWQARLCLLDRTGDRSYQIALT